jgi:hypothetical protein
MTRDDQLTAATLSELANRLQVAALLASRLAQLTNDARDESRGLLTALAGAVEAVRRIAPTGGQ